MQNKHNKKIDEESLIPKPIAKFIKQNLEIICLLAILLLAAYLRYTGYNWDTGAHLHPDERYITLTGTAIERAESFHEYLDPVNSPMSPANKTYGAYIYGTFPLFLAKELAYQHDQLCWPNGEAQAIDTSGFLAKSFCLRTTNSLGETSFVQLNSYQFFNLLGRILSASFDLGTIVIIYWVGNNFIKKKRFGIYAASLYAVTAFAIQQSHFFTMENFETFWVLATFAFVIKLINTTSKKYSILFSIMIAICFGTALASKLSAIVFIPIILAALGMHFLNMIPKLHFSRSLLFSLSLLGYIVIVSYATFRLFQPYIFAQANWLDFTINPDFLSAFEQQRRAIAGEFMFPPQWQWVNKTAFWFPFKNIIVWGFGLPLGLGVIAGLPLSGYELYKNLRNASRKHHLLDNLSSPTLLSIVWILGSFLYRGGAFVKTMRYFFALLPFLILLFVNALYLLKKKHKQAFYTTFYIVFGLSLLWSMAFSSIYKQDTTRVAASKWVYQNVPETATYANEHWDDGIPFGTEGVEVRYYQNSQEIEVYNQESEKSPIFHRFERVSEGEGFFPYARVRDQQIIDPAREQALQEEKVKMLYDKLSKVDYVFVTSNRARGTVGQLPEYYPIMNRYYKSLDSGDLGFELVHTEKSYPKFLGIEINDEKAEEAFWVYDHPTVRIYRKYADISFGAFRDQLILESDI